MAATEPRPKYDRAMSDNDKARAILYAAERADMLRWRGMHEGHYVIERNDEVEVLNAGEVPEMLIFQFLETYG